MGRIRCSRTHVRYDPDGNRSNAIDADAISQASYRTWSLRLHPTAPVPSVRSRGSRELLPSPRPTRDRTRSHRAAQTKAGTRRIRQREAQPNTGDPFRVRHNPKSSVRVIDECTRFISEQRLLLEQKALKNAQTIVNRSHTHEEVLARHFRQVVTALYIV